jgi:hypothetical protein
MKTHFKWLTTTIFTLISLPIYAQTVALRCVGDLTEVYVNQPTAKFVVEYFYELSPNLIAVHIGERVQKMVRKDIDMKDDSEYFKHSGFYKFEKNQFQYYEYLDAKFPFPIESNQSFDINRLTGKWKLKESFNQNYPERSVYKGFVKSREIYGNCESWVNKPKF